MPTDSNKMAATTRTSIQLELGGDLSSISAAMRQVCRKRWRHVNTNSATAKATVLAHAGVAAADLPFVAVGVFKKNSVVARRVFGAVFGSFYVVRAGIADNRADTIDLFFAFCTVPSVNADQRDRPVTSRKDL